MTNEAPPNITDVSALAYDIPLEQPESDGTLTWSSTTLVVVRVLAGEHLGVGYTYAPAAAAHIVNDTLTTAITGRNALAPGGAWEAMARAVRNQGLRGPAAAAVAAVDIGLWDLKARLLDIPLVALLDGCHDSVPAYGSGGFTDLDDGQLSRQVAGWADDLEGLRLLRDRSPAGMEVAAGEYGWDITHFRGLLQRGALRPDRSRAGHGLGVDSDALEPFLV